MTNPDSSKLLILSTSPHIRAEDSVRSIMLHVIIALVPSLAASVYFFGLNALMLTLISIITCVVTEWVIVVKLMKKHSPVGDLSAVVTGLLFAFNLPPGLPWWMAVLGSVFAIAVVKCAFGGLGNNFINPALAGRAFLMASYPAAMTNFQSTTSGVFNGLRATTLETLKQGIDGVTTATPLQTVKDVCASGMYQPLDFQEALMNLFTGNISGCIGETSAAAIIIGGLYMAYKRVIGFTIPVLYILTVFILFYFFGENASLLSTESLVLPLYHILSGGLMLGAFFMATDMVTSPITRKGQVIFAAGCGILTFVIRKFGGYPEGVSYSILLMNLTVPLIDRYIRPVKYGRVKRDV